MSERKADYEWRDRLLLKWVIDDDQTAFGNGNLETHFSWVDGESRWLTSRERAMIPWSSRTAMYARIPSPKLLYRIACTFDVHTRFFGPAGYKCVWFVNVVHKPTETSVGFGESKGGSGFWTEFYSLEGGGNYGDIAPPKEFLDDLKDLIDYFDSDVCAHPYDGVVAGEVA